MSFCLTKSNLNWTSDNDDQSEEETLNEVNTNYGVGN